MSDVEQNVRFIRELVTTYACSACYTREKLEEMVRYRFAYELKDAPADTTDALLALLDDLLAKHRAEEGTWDVPTTNDRIDRAFAELAEKGIIALQNASQTLSGGWERVREVASNGGQRPRAIGATFYHEQDLERGVAGQGLNLAFGALDGGDDVAVGRAVCDVLVRHGVTTDWNGDASTRIVIPPFTWQKRSTPLSPKPVRSTTKPKARSRPRPATSPKPRSK